MLSENTLKDYWSTRYAEGRTGWDIGYPSTPFVEYFKGVHDKAARMLVPGAGNAYEAEHLFQSGYSNVFVLDISESPLLAFKRRVPDFPDDQLIQDDFFKHSGTYDFILEQTFFCSFPPTRENRSRYAEHMSQLLDINGKLVGVWFDIPLTGDMEKRPFGGTREEYLGYFAPYFDTITFERCYNSIPPRDGKELFGIFRKK